MIQGRSLPSARFMMTIMVMMVLFIGSLWGVVELAHGIMSSRPVYTPRTHATILEPHAVGTEYILTLGQ